jgi:hypothetical protein
MVPTGELVNGLDFTCVELADRGEFTIPADILRALWPGSYATHLLVSAKVLSFPVRFEAGSLPGVKCPCFREAQRSIFRFNR